MNKIIFILVLLSSIIGNNKSLPETSLTDINGNVITKAELEKENVFFLIASLKCGYCLKDIKYYNALINKYSQLTDFKFIVLLENDEKYIENFKKTNEFINEKWIVIPSAEKYYTKIWKEKLFPEYIIFKKGKLDKTFAFSNLQTMKRIKNYLMKNLKE